MSRSTQAKIRLATHVIGSLAITYSSINEKGLAQLAFWITSAAMIYFALKELEELER